MKIMVVIEQESVEVRSMVVHEDKEVADEKAAEAKELKEEMRMERMPREVRWRGVRGGGRVGLREGGVEGWRERLKYIRISLEPVMR